MRNVETVKNTITIANNVAFPTLRKGKAFKALLFVASEVDKNLAPGSVHVVPVSLFNDLLKFKLSNKDTAFLLEELETLRVDWASYNQDWSGFSHVVSSCRYDSKKDTITYSFDPMFVKEYIDKKTPFKNIPISLIMGFRSNYALKIYELAYQYYDPKRKEGKTPSYTYQSLRALFNLSDDQYKNSGHFFQKVIKNPLKETTEISDYLIEFHHNNRRGGLRRYWFTVKLGAQIKFAFSRIEKFDSRVAENEAERKMRETEDKERAKRFLQFWDQEFNDFAKKKMTDAEREKWVDPLLAEPPLLNTFSEFWIIDNFLKTSEEKKKAYFELDKIVENESNTRPVL